MENIFKSYFKSDSFRNYFINVLNFSVQFMFIFFVLGASSIANAQDSTTTCRNVGYGVVCNTRRDPDFAALEAARQQSARYAA